MRDYKVFLRDIVAAIADVESFIAGMEFDASPTKEIAIKTIYSYACKDYPGLGACPGRFYAETEDELWKHMELHASVAHEEDPASWTDEDRTQLKALIKTERVGN